ncbi:MAG: hypothetical protein ACRDZ2_02025, partial [Ilumatobacteraceae bacterium]
RSMPHARGALAAGALSPEHVDLLAGANNGHRRTLFEPHEEMLVGQCKLLRFADAYRMIEHWKQHADADRANDDAARQHKGRGASAATTLDGMVDLRALLDPIGGSAFLTELVRLIEVLRLDDQRTRNVRTATQRRADAIVEMAHRSRTAQDGGLRPRPLITIHVGETSFARICELAAGTVIAPGQVVPYLADADLERIVFDGPRPSHLRVPQAALHRRPTPGHRSARPALPTPSGCDEPASRCDIDHITPHSEGGPTTHDNGELRFWPHNRNPDLRTPAHPTHQAANRPTRTRHRPTTPTRRRRSPRTEPHPTRREYGVHSCRAAVGQRRAAANSS